MAEQKCPMCGKLNPPELDVCQFCEARLKPLIVSPSEDSSGSPSGRSSDEPSADRGAPDWLSSLRDRQEDTEFEPDEDALPSWPKHEEDERPGLPTGDEIEAPNWLDNLRSPSSEDEDVFMDAGVEEQDEDEDEEEVWEPPGLGTGEEEAVPDWLTGMRASPESPDEEADILQQDEEGGSPDWLARIRSRQQDEDLPGEPDSEQPQDLPDWLRTDDLSTAGTMADWPSSIRDRAEQSAADWQEAQPPEEPSDETLPDWLSSPQSDDREAADADELPSWLKRGEEIPASASEEIPDWMAGSDEPGPAADDFPDWLETGESEPLPAEGIPEGTQDESSEGLPDWLQKDTEEPQAEAQDWQAEGEAQVSPDGAIPDWLEPEEAETGPVDEIPDWLSDLSDEEEPLETTPADLTSEELPEWLADLDQKVEADEAEAETAAEEADLEAEPAQALPEWLVGVGPAVAGMADEALEDTPLDKAPLDKAPDEALVPFTTPEEELDVDAYEQEVPDWLADVKAAEEALEPAGEIPTGPKDADLAPAELPSWLEAMRPVEAEAAPEILDERDRQVVSAGPLAGLRGVLPAEPEISKVQKPPAYSVKLQVSDMQQERASMLEELIRAEGLSRPIPKRPLVSSQNLLRMVFAFVLFLSILWPLVTAGPVAPVPVFTDETGAANQLISQIGSQAPVLVAVDYQPGLSGEMDAIASALFDHLMLRGAYLALVSTTASGPIQAEHVMAISNRQFGHSYLGAGEYTNLGYIPGGPTGLISFASNPRAMMTYALDDGRPAWVNSPLQSVQDLSDFALITVITENPETARAWIEQVQPKLDDTPLIMAISAQAEPMVRPYYEAFPKQVQGMVVGLAGSVAYESLMGHQGLSHGYWNSFGVGLLVAVVLIFIGGVINMIPILTRGGRESSAEREGSR